MNPLQDALDYCWLTYASFKREKIQAKTPEWYKRLFTAFITSERAWPTV